MSLPRSTSAPLDVSAFVAALDAAPEVELHSLMVVHHGEVVAERWWAPYRPDTPHLLYSLSKSFTSTALGFAVAEGLVDLDATVLSYFPEFNGPVTDPRSRAMKVRHIAAMASGHDDERIDEARAAGDGDLVLGLLLTPPEREPGTWFAYNQPCTYTVAAIIQKVTGGSLTAYLKPRLYDPLGITSYGWVKGRTGREIGYSGLHATTEAIAKLGLLYQQKGVFDGQRLLSEEWVAEATRVHIPTERDQPDWSHGYGFQFWGARHGYRGDGAYGQFMLVLPEADAVVAITSQSPDMQAVLDAAWSHLLPALESPAAAPPVVVTELTRPAGTREPLPEGTFRAGAVLREVSISGGVLTLHDGGPAVTAKLGDGWVVTGPVATAQAWQGGVLAVDVVFVETPHRLHLSLDPAAGTADAEWETTPLGVVSLGHLRMPG